MDLQFKTEFLFSQPINFFLLDELLIGVELS